jgi:fructose-bisphosphate aldolase, class II
MHNQGRYFCEFAANAARNASVPISLHLDHCLKPEDTELGLTYPFDSIMVDGSMFDEQGNIDYVKSVVEKAREKNICIEAEIGRMEGCEDGLPDLDLDAIYTNPDAAKDFVETTGVHFLAPSFGNVHGPYPPGGAEKHWQLDR